MTLSNFLILEDENKSQRRFDVSIRSLGYCRSEMRSSQCWCLSTSDSPVWQNLSFSNSFYSVVTRLYTWCYDLYTTCCIGLCVEGLVPKHPKQCLVALFWEVVEPLGGEAYLKQEGDWECVSGDCKLSQATQFLLPLCFLSPMRWVASASCSHHREILHRHISRNNRTKDSALNPLKLKLCAKINPFSLKLFVSEFCHSDEKSDSHMYINIYILFQPDKFNTHKNC
jgi:hypothetical protein